MNNEDTFFQFKYKKSVSHYGILSKLFDYVHILFETSIDYSLKKQFKTHTTVIKKWLFLLEIYTLFGHWKVTMLIRFIS